MHVGEAEIAAMEAVGELFLVKAKKVEEGGLDVLDEFNFSKGNKRMIRPGNNLSRCYLVCKL